LPKKPQHSKKSRRKSRNTAVPKKKNVTDNMAGKFKLTPHGKLALTLSTELSISRNDPKQESTADKQDALQEDLIAKEKTLDELHLQISEMQGMIGTLQNKLALNENSFIPSKNVVELDSSIVSSNDHQTFIGRYWRELVGLVSLSLAIYGIYLYRRRQEDHEHWDGNPP